MCVEDGMILIRKRDLYPDDHLIAWETTVYRKSDWTPMIMNTRINVVETFIDFGHDYKKSSSIGDGLRRIWRPL